MNACLELYLDSSLPTIGLGQPRLSSLSSHHQSSMAELDQTTKAVDWRNQTERRVGTREEIMSVQQVWAVWGLACLFSWSVESVGLSPFPFGAWPGLSLDQRPVLGAC